MSSNYRRFVLQRDEDETGVSGTGVVAEGVEFSNGVVALHWTSDFPTSVVFHHRGMESVEHVHGHSGKTKILWLDRGVRDDVTTSALTVVTTGVLGWGNRKSGCEAYGPGGRWEGRSEATTPGEVGDLLGDHLEREGATEGARLVVVALPRFCPVDPDLLAAQIRSMVEVEDEDA